MLKLTQYIALFAFCILSNFTTAQFSNNWCFGDSAGINFNTSPPTTFISAVKSRGSCASISDSIGNLLFYYSYDPTAVLTGQNPFNGGEVYTSAHQLMQNGDLLVSGAWYNEGVIIPKPQELNKFYLFF